MTNLFDAIEAMTGDKVKTSYSREEYIIVVFNTNGGCTLYSYPNVREIKATDPSLKNITIVSKNGDPMPISRISELIMQSMFKFIAQAESDSIQVCAVFQRVSEKEFLLINNNDGINIHHYIKKDKIIAPYLSMKPKYADMVNVLVNTIIIKNKPYSVGSFNMYKLKMSGLNVVVNTVSSGKFTSLSLCDKTNEVILSINIFNGNMYTIDTCRDERIFNYFEHLEDTGKMEHKFSWVSYIADLLYPSEAKVEAPTDYGKRISEFITNNINNGRLTKPSDISKLINSLYVEDSFDSLLENMEKENKIRRTLSSTPIE